MANIVNKDRVPYRLWNPVNKVWDLVHVLTKANSVDANDGKTLETKVGAINGITSDVNCEDETVAASAAMVNQLNSNLDSFQNGVDTIVNGCIANGSTPTDNTPSAIVTSISNIYTNRYSSGRTQGRTDVTSSPNSYSLYTKSQYDANYTSGYNAGNSNAIPCAYYTSSVSGTTNSGSITKSLTLTKSLSVSDKYFTISENKATCKVAGTYNISLYCPIIFATCPYVTKNGSLVIGTNHTEYGSLQHNTVSGNVNLAVNDYVQFYYIGTAYGGETAGASSGSRITMLKIA